MSDKLFKMNDPLSHLHRQDRESRRFALMDMIDSSLRSAYATACDNLVWTLRRAMLILMNSKGELVAREIWDLNDLQAMVSYWDYHVSPKISIPKLADLLYEGFKKRSVLMKTLDWKSELEDKVCVALPSRDNTSLRQCIDEVPIIIEAADIVAEFIEQNYKRNIYKHYKSVAWLEEQPQEDDVEMDVTML